MCEPRHIRGKKIGLRNEGGVCSMSSRSPTDADGIPTDGCSAVSDSRGLPKVRNGWIVLKNSLVRLRSAIFESRRPARQLFITFTRRQHESIFRCLSSSRLFQQYRWLADAPGFAHRRE